MSSLWPTQGRAATKPRETGVTMLIDNGYPTGYFTDVVSSHCDYIDFIKFGWGTALVTRDIEKKVQCARDNDVAFCLGGTFFEKCLAEDKLDEFEALYKKLGARHMEISNGTIDLGNEEKAVYIKRYAGDYEVFSEVGYKDTERSQELHPAKWVEYIEQDLAAGATRVIAEARESGTSGICRADGEVRFGLISEIGAMVDVDKLVFEAPNKSLQVYFIKKFGPNVNLANISFGDVIGLETLRNGLRGDTLKLFGPAK